MQDNKAILEQANAAIKRGDYEGFLSFCTDDTEWTFVGEQTIRGKEAVRRYMADVYKEPPKFTVTHLIAEENNVVALGSIMLKNEAGNEEDYTYCDVWQFRNGKMAALSAFVVKSRL